MTEADRPFAGADHVPRGPVDQVFDLLTASGRTVATAESLTGGLLGAVLTLRSGSSAIYRGGVVAYAVDLKHRLLGVSTELLERYGPVHPETAAAMASGVRERLGADYGLATTGVAGPEAHGAQPVGTVDLACAGPGGLLRRRLALVGDREVIRAGAVQGALDLLVGALRAGEEPPTG